LAFFRDKKKNLSYGSEINIYDICFSLTQVLWIRSREDDEVTSRQQNPTPWLLKLSVKSRSWINLY
jgi:hypothetical protein